MKTFQLEINGDLTPVAAPAHWTLLEVLRYQVGLTGTKQGCDKGDCGACTVLVDGRARLACITLVTDVEGHAVTTIEGLVGKDGLDVLQQTFDECGALQCGFCQPGMILAARACLDRDPEADSATVRESLASNLCRCTGYTKIFEAVEQAVREGKASGHGDPVAPQDFPAPSPSSVPGASS